MSDPHPADVPQAAPPTPSISGVLDDLTRTFYLRAMDVLHEAGVEFLVGGAYSLAYHAGIVRHTKDLDLFVRRSDLDAALQTLQKAGYRCERTFPHWLAKAFDSPQGGDAFVDLIYGSGNGLCPVDDEWFANAVDGQALDRPAKLMPAEEVIWTKSFIQERERFDGADINHVLLKRGQSLDWNRLLRRVAGHERVLLAHLLLFGYAFPSDRGCVPDWVTDELLDRMRYEPIATEKVCAGTSLSRAQYLVDLRERGYADARLEPRGSMNREDIEHWTAAIGTIR